MNLRDGVLVVRERALAAARKASWLPPLLIRLCLAAVFIPSGWGKLHDLQKVTDFFTELGIPWPHRTRSSSAPASSGAARSCWSVSASRLAALPLIVSMTIAILTAKRADIGGPVDLFAVDELIYGVLAIAIVVLGAGAVSADGLATRLLFHPNEHQQPEGDRS